MYTRDLTEPPFKPIKKGKPAFGNYKGAPQFLDIKGIEAPFINIPLPSVIARFAIRSHLSFIFSIQNYIGSVEFFDSKLFGYAEVVIWNMKTNTKLAYHVYTGPRRRLIPIKLTNAICASFRKTRYIRIGWDKRYNRISLLFNVKGDSIRPNANGALIGKFNAPDTAEMTIIAPSPTMRRCSATWTTVFSIHGAITLEGTQNTDPKHMTDDDGLAVLSMYRNYYKLHNKTTQITGLGIIDSKKIEFRIVTSTLDAADTSKYNTNALFVDGEITTLPQIYITHPFGITKKWVIQDTDSMVDLEFTPLSDNARMMNAIIISTSYHMIYGTFNGILLTNAGEKITLKNFPGIIKETLLRL
ncbi:MAG: DUF2804 domain-containing protein [Treponema sp.]|nr:DUF2804 domain-containing protein [Treponema sp.]